VRKGSGAGAGAEDEGGAGHLVAVHRLEAGIADVAGDGEEAELRRDGVGRGQVEDGAAAGTARADREAVVVGDEVLEGAGVDQLGGDGEALDRGGADGDAGLFAGAAEQGGVGGQIAGVGVGEGDDGLDLFRRAEGEAGLEALGAGLGDVLAG
jgi:hypothetical protein